MKKYELKKENEINQVCYRCGVNANVLTNIKKHGKCPYKLSYNISTFHKGICDCCEEITSITEVRDFFHPDFSLLQKNWILKLKK